MLHKLALQRATRAIYHVVGGLVTHKQIAEAIAGKHSLQTKSISAEASQLYGPSAPQPLAKTVCPTQKAKAELLWQPKFDGVSSFNVLLEQLRGNLSGNFTTTALFCQLNDLSELHCDQPL